LLQLIVHRAFAHVFYSLAELPKLECCVSLLYGHEQAEHYLDWIHGTHGIQVDFDDPSTGERRSATFLPDIAPREGMSKREAVDALIRKSGCNKRYISESLRERIRLTRYLSTAADVTFAQYRDSTKSEYSNDAENSHKRKSRKASSF
jgi:AMMECR1 domain-containing protein